MEEYVKINKPTARKMYRHGVPIYLIPCKINENVFNNITNAPVKPIKISLFSDKVYNATDFDSTVNAYEYYNCNAEVGYYAHYYVTVSDKNSYEMCKFMCT